MLAVLKEQNHKLSIKDIPWSSTRVAVVGAARSGIAATKLLKALGAKVRVIDRSLSHIPRDFVVWSKKAGCNLVIGKHCLDQFDGIDVVIPSPGVCISNIQPFFSGSVSVFSETELAWYQLTSEKVIAITGTSGKTTTASLCGSMFNEQGISCFVGGNIGVPLSEYVLGDTKVEIVVLELSSFQLQTCIDFRPEVAVLLNISPNHLDYHSHIEEYISAKMQICKKQHSTDYIVIKENLDKLLTEHGIKSKKLLYQDTGMFLTTQLVGSHNRENAEAAWTACKEFGVSVNAAKRAVEKFHPLGHRLEPVKDLHGVSYINDSKCSTVEALLAALSSFEQPILLLAGGIFKGGDLVSLRPSILKKVRAVGLFGDSREVFEDAWSDLVLMHWEKTLEEAVKFIFRIACPGDVVLLAPATSSFDQYLNYKERGNDFKRIVHEVLI